MNKCQECYGFIGSSCCCQLTQALQIALDAMGIEEFWITDIKYDYGDSTFIEEVEI